MNNVAKHPKRKSLGRQIQQTQQTLIQFRGFSSPNQLPVPESQEIEASFRQWFNGWDWVWVAQGRYRGNQLQALGYTYAEARDRLIYYAQKFQGGEPR